MFAPFLYPAHVPCSECGASIARDEVDEHECDPERRVEFALFQRREEIAAFEDEVSAYFASPRGRFDLFYAERDRLRAA